RRREADNKAAVVSRGRTLTPNHYTIEVSPPDHERLSGLESELRSDHRQVIGDHAIEQAYSFVGHVSVDFALADDLDTGKYRVVYTTERPDGRPAAQPAHRGGCHPASRANPIVWESPHYSARPAPARRSPHPARSSPPSRPTPTVRPAASSPPARQRTIEASVSIDGRTQTLRHGTNTFGRSSSSSAFVIDDPGVSRRHFRSEE